MSCEDLEQRNSSSDDIYLLFKGKYAPLQGLQTAVTHPALTAPLSAGCINRVSLHPQQAESATVHPLIYRMCDCEAFKQV